MKDQSDGYSQLVSTPTPEEITEPTDLKASTIESNKSDNATITETKPLKTDADIEISGTLSIEPEPEPEMMEVYAQPSAPSTTMVKESRTYTEDQNSAQSRLNSRRRRGMNYHSNASSFLGGSDNPKNKD